MNNEQLVDDNAALLTNLRELLVIIDDAVFQQEISDIYSSSIGSHVRHIIEHYQMYLAGHEHGVINYDLRQRNIKLETDREYALGALQLIIDELQKLSIDDAPVEVVIDLSAQAPASNGNAVGAANTQSTLARELAFLHSHTTHHHASIAMIFTALDKPLPGREFGLAPATQRNQIAAGAAQS